MTDSVKILIVDDDIHVLNGYCRSLRKQFQVGTANSGQQALKLLEEQGPYAVVVSDMRMPGMDGLELLAKLKEISPNTARIMLTGNADQQTAIDAVNQGQVFKFLTKPCSGDTMASAIGAGIKQYQQILENAAHMERNAAQAKGLTKKLSYQAHHDILTGLANRQAFELRLQSLLKPTDQESPEHALCHLDLDHFHVINDICGTTAGDELLRQIGRLLSSQRRKGDMVARLASDEFGILLSDCSLDSAQQIMETLQKELKEFRFEWEEKLFEISISIGLIPVTGQSKSVTALLCTAETACNVAKDRGCNRLHVASSQDQELTKRLNEAQWVARINHALHEDRFRLYYQPIVHVAPDKSEGDHYEILIRLENEEGEIVPPIEFLPTAERYHLSPQIDCWVIQATVDWLSRHPQSLQRLCLCSINLSGLSLGNQEVYDFILDTFKSTSVPPEKICFEITETAAIAQFDVAVQFIKSLKREGFRFSLDDFGAGLSSFAYLKNIPVDFLKIDGAFVKNMDSDHVNRTVVKSINEIGHVMGKKTIAEFVENDEILRHLRGLGVDYAQGYLISAPRPLDELE